MALTPSSPDSRRRVVVTGMGALTPLGLTVDEFWDGLVQGRSGIGPMTLCDPADFPSRIAGEVKGFDPHRYIERKDARRMARFSQLAVAAAVEAIAQAHLTIGSHNAERIGVLLGNGNGGFPTVEAEARALYLDGPGRVNPLLMLLELPNMAACQVSLAFGLKGYNSTIITACAAATQAIGEATEVIRQGKADAVLAGGTEAGISRLGVAGFSGLKALSTRNDEPERASRPFDAERDGFVPAEGAAILVLEGLEHARGRGAPILAEVAGYGASSDAYHLVAPDPTGAGAARAIRAALADAGLPPEAIAYVNAHGTSTPLNDTSETLAIKKAFGEHAHRLAISSTKSMVGHTLGASGALEAVACVRTLRDGIIHPTTNYEHPDPECDLDYVPNRARRASVAAALSNSFGFGGQNACLVFRRWEGS
ncbi:MAG: beta-ketoacyl-ACP synthase II [Chloroflexi bacterium]|nr:beta-ketoacyl-ACP synthase II [Chloroflexota bacterium]